jgi:hypothetical protein
MRLLSEHYSGKAYAVDVSQIHQDTTSVKVTGAYERQHRRAVQLVWGISKDHRPDLRQAGLRAFVTRDGAVPVLFQVHDGNRRRSVSRPILRECFSSTAYSRTPEFHWRFEVRPRALWTSAPPPPSWYLGNNRKV